MINSRLYLQKAFFVIGIFILFLGIIDANAVVLSQNDSISAVDYTRDTLSADSLIVDSLSLDSLSLDTLPFDSISSDSLVQPKKEVLDAEVQYQARDSIIFFMDGTGFLYGEGKVKYLQAKPIELEAEYIRFKLDSSTIYAIGTTDSVGNPIGDPVFKDGNDSYASKYMSYNFKTKKGFVRGVVTQQDEGHIIADQTKMMEDNTFFMKGGKYTTCDHHDHPHFYLQLTKAKMEPGKHLAAGPAYMVLADVPLPLALPFGFFPVTKSYSSGIVMPQFGEELERGLFVKDGGYYWAINDYVDLLILGDYYTKGTWAVSLASQYRLRYKFSGSFNLSYREDVRGEKNMPDYSKAKNFRVSWRHQQDAKASQYSSFSASVDFSTSGYNTSNINNYYNPAEQSKNITSSSINYTQRFPESPWSISLNANLTQRTQDSTISLTLPTLSVNMSQVYPFKRKKPIGNERWYEKIRLSYSMTASNSINTKENMLFKSSFVRDWKNGVKHTLPISASFTFFKYINFSISENYNERWYFNRINRDWDVARQEEVQDTTYGFYRVYDFSTNASLSTKLYGYYTPIRKWFGDYVDRIRHVMTPSISFSYHPDFGSDLFKFYDSYTKTIVDKNSVNSISQEEVIYSPYSNGMYGVPGRGVSSTLSFGLQNNVEMKVKDKSDSTGMAYKKVSLIDNFSLNWGYNFAADSMNWSNLSVSLRLKLTKRFSLNLSGQFDPYRYLPNERGSIVRTGQLHWNHGEPMHFKGTRTSFSYTFNNDTFKKKDKKKKKEEEEEEVGMDAAMADPLDPNAHVERDPITGEPINEMFSDKDEDKDKDEDEDSDDGYTKPKIPWSFTVNYSFGFVEQMNKEFYNPKTSAYKLKYTHSLTFSGSIQPTEKWRMNFSGSVDLEHWKITQTSLSIYRDLHCWSLSASVSPFGLYKSFMVTIGANASMLRDLKYDKRSGTSANINWLDKRK